MERKRPFVNTYWVDFSDIPFSELPEGGLLVGAYPGADDETAIRRRAEAFLEIGVTVFIDLTEAGEYGARPYFPIFQAAAQKQNMSLTHHRFAIQDQGTPEPEQMAQILDAVDAAVFGGDTVYVHCYGGIGRSGTVVGCWLVRHGLDGEAAIAQMAQWRQGIPSGRYASPETATQHALILSWQPGR